MRQAIYSLTNNSIKLMFSEWTKSHQNVNDEVVPKTFTGINVSNDSMDSGFKICKLFDRIFVYVIFMTSFS